MDNEDTISLSSNQQAANNDTINSMKMVLYHNICIPATNNTIPFVLPWNCHH